MILEGKLRKKMDKITVDKIADNLDALEIMKEFNDALHVTQIKLRYNFWSTVACAVVGVVNSGLIGLGIFKYIQGELREMEDRISDKINTIVQEAGDISDEARDKLKEIGL